MVCWRYDEHVDDIHDDCNDDDGPAEDDDFSKNTNSYSDGNCVNDNAMILMILDDFDDAIIIPVVSDAGGYIA